MYREREIWYGEFQIPVSGIFLEKQTGKMIEIGDHNFRDKHNQILRIHILSLVPIVGSH